MLADVDGPRGQPGSRICAFLVSTVRVHAVPIYYVGDAFEVLTFIFIPAIRPFE